MINAIAKNGATSRMPMSDTSHFALTAFMTTFPQSLWTEKFAMHFIASLTPTGYNKARAASGKTVFRPIFIGF
jgi:hypothetical protein